MLSLLVKGGTIVDGTGSPGFHGSVGVEGDRVVILRGDISGVSAQSVIDATGRVVCPGFIDIHAHSGLMLLADPLHEPKVRQGVTTEVIGVDGNSYAPFRSRGDLEMFIELNSGLDGDPPLPNRWSTVDEYLEMFSGGAAVNVASMIGNSPIRIFAMGWQDRRPSSTELVEMRRLVRLGMEEGAFGLSTGLDYPPGSYADTAELLALSEEASRLGGIYHTHVRGRLGDRFLDPYREAIEIGRCSGIPVHITHFCQRTTSPGSARQLLDLVEEARDEGIDVTFDSYPYAYGSTRLTAILPEWLQEGGPESLMSALSSIETRIRLRKEIRPRATSWHEMWLTNLRHPDYRELDGRSVAEVADAMGKDVADAVCDLLLAERLGVSYVSAVVNGATLRDFVTHHLSMVGSDALLIGDHPNPRTYGTFPLILAEYVRDERLLSLPEAIRKMTSFPAQRLGLPDRGLLRDGFKADLVVVNPRSVGTRSTRREPKRFPSGIEYVVVNGRVVIDNDRHTGALPGRALRRGRPST